jgi:hypothetical protein
MDPKLRILEGEKGILIMAFGLPLRLFKRFALSLSLALTLLAVVALGAGETTFYPDIPKVWDDRAVKTMEVPLAQRDRSPRYMTSAEYYALKVRPIYRSYPAYAKGREPAGYLESLKKKEPEIIFDPGGQAGLRIGDSVPSRARVSALGGQRVLACVERWRASLFSSRFSILRAQEGGVGSRDQRLRRVSHARPV